MNTKHIFLFSGILLMAFGLTLHATAQPTYVSKTYLKYKVFYRIVNYDSGYIVYSNAGYLYKINYNGDTVKRKKFVGSKPGIYSTEYFSKVSDNLLILVGTFKPDTTSNKYIFISKLNQNLDTLWVKHYYNGNPNSSLVATNHEDTIAVAFNKYSTGGLYVSTFTANGDFINTTFYPKPTNINWYYLADIYPVNGTKYLMALSGQNNNDDIIIVVYSVNQSIYFSFTSSELHLGSLYARVFLDYQGNISVVTSWVFDDGEIFINAFNLNGQYLYSRVICEDNYYGHYIGTNAIMLGNGDFVITGEYDGAMVEGLLIRTNSYGQLKWMRRFEGGGSFGTQLVGVTETSNHFLACVGEKDYNEWLLVVDSLGCEAPGVCWVGEEEISAPPQENLFEVFPNPAGEEVWVKSVAPLAGIAIYAMNGQKMPLPALTEENPLRIDTRTWPAGLYVVRARLQSNRVLTQKFVKLRNP